MNTNPDGKSRMNAVKRSLLLLPFICGAVHPAWGQTIVDCGAAVQSQKRGLATGTMSAADFQAIAPGVSWYYNWSAVPQTVPAGTSIQFLPMSWNGTSGAESALSSYLAAGNRPSYVLGLNEPNFTTQADMTPLQCATAYSQIQAICAPYGIPVVAPQMAIGTTTADSITAYDPIQSATVTYTFQEPFLQAFEYYCGSSIPPAMSTHSYGGYGEVTWITGSMHTDFPNQAVWLTEFNQNDSTSDATSVADVISTVDYCERTPWIQGYAWFMSRVSGNAYNSILTSTSGSLTPAGQAYVQMPVHLSTLFYRLPGTLQADRYVTMNNMNIEPSTDTGEIADMISTASQGTIDYNLQVNTAGSYSLGVRASNATGAINIYKGSTLLGTVNVTSTAWATYNTSLTLASGTQTLHFVLASNNQKISTLQFTQAVPISGACRIVAMIALGGAGLLALRRRRFLI